MTTSSDVIGDIGELKLQTITVPATHSGTGHNSTGHFKLARTAELRHYIDTHATVQILGDIQLEISGPVSSTIATTAVVALYPDKYSAGPTTKSHVVSLEGRVSIQHSLLVGSVLSTPKKAREVGESLKVKTLVDFPPVVAYHVDIAGGSSASTWTLTAHVPIVVGGVSHHCTWQ